VFINNAISLNLKIGVLFFCLIGIGMAVISGKWFDSMVVNVDGVEYNITKTITDKIFIAVSVIASLLVKQIPYYKMFSKNNSVKMFYKVSVGLCVLYYGTKGMNKIYNMIYKRFGKGKKNEYSEMVTALDPSGIIPEMSKFSKM
jgi:hypothetical protein